MQTGRIETQWTFWGFNAVFEQNLKDSPTYEQAYEATENLHETNFGHRRYANYNSFRKNRERRLKKWNKVPVINN